MTDALTRLHIRPFSAALFPSFINTAQASIVEKVDYFRVKTFPEHEYGFIELPKMEAEKLKKKFNGTILKGQKVAIDTARPVKRRRLYEGKDAEAEAPILDSHSSDAAKRVTPKKKDLNLLLGHELLPGRKVKRGWTIPDAKSVTRSKKSAQKNSKYSETEELLFRTQVPPNKVDRTGSSKSVKRKKKDKQDANQSGQDILVHEYKTSTKVPSFLRAENSGHHSKDLQYVDGQGWVDGNGRIIEGESTRSAEIRSKVATKPTGRRVTKPRHEVEDASSPDDETTSSSGFDESQSEAETSDQVLPQSSRASPTGSVKAAEAQGEVNVNPATITVSEVHPLEAIFKKPKHPSTSQDVAKPSLEISTTFSFFDAMNGDDLDNELKVPLTPFSSQDMRMRGLRSAAPTPDTAHPSRFNSTEGKSHSSEEGMEDIEEEEYFGQDVWQADKLEHSATDTPHQPVSDFEKKFWEDRGDNNRAWKLRRRTVLKEKRQRENRARRPKNW